VLRPMTAWTVTRLRLQPLLAVSLIACTSPDDPRADAAMDAGGDAADATPAPALVLLVDGPDPRTVLRRTGLWRVRVSWAGVPVADRVLGEGEDVVFPATARFEGLGAGPFDIQAWFDRDGDARFEGCPFPPDVEAAIDPGRFENISAARQGVVPGAPVTLTLARRLCGPGRLETGLGGQLEVDAPVTHGVYFAFRPSSACGAGIEPGAAAFTVVGFPVGVSQSQAFRLGELLPGCFEVTAFADEDGDLRPSACGTPSRGGDHRVVALGAIALRAGETVSLDAPVALVSDPRCEAALTGERLRIGLDPGALVGAPAGLLAANQAPLRVRYIDALTEATDDLDVGRAVALDGALADLTVTGLAPGRYRRVVYLDLDLDGQLTTCGGLSTGMDAFTHVADEVVIEGGTVRDAGALRLRRADDCDVRRTLLTGSLDLPIEGGALGSGRPLRIELVPTGAEGEPRGLLLAANHSQVGVPAVEEGRRRVDFSRLEAFAPGEYLARAFVDFDRDGVARTCDVEPWGDRVVSGAARLRVPSRADADPAAPIELGALTLDALACPTPSVTLRPALALAEGAAVPDEPSSAPPLFAHLRLVEEGGWTAPVAEAPRASPFPPPLPPLALVPGRYRVVAWLEPNPSPDAEPCARGESPTWRGEVIVELGASAADVAARLELGAGCPR